MVTAHLETVLAGTAYVLVIAGIDEVAALGSLDIDKLDFAVLLQLFPVDGTLVFRDIDTVKLNIVGVQRRRGLGFGWGSSLASSIDRCRLLGLFLLLGGRRSLRLLLFRLLFLGHGRLDVSFLLGFLVLLLISLLILLLVSGFGVILVHALACRLLDISLLSRGSSRQGQESQNYRYQ